MEFSDYFYINGQGKLVFKSDWLEQEVSGVQSVYHILCLTH